VRQRAVAAAEPLPQRIAGDAASEAPAGAASAAPGRRGKKDVLHITQLAKELSAELELAADANGRLKLDLDSALASLRKAAEEARERAEERDRLALEVEKRSGAARDLLAELELLEAERDGALAQVARFARELRESRARVDEQTRLAEKQRGDAEEARGQVRRLAAELEARVAERDAARSELTRLRAEKDELAEALVAARAEADEALESRSALEEIERALGEARSRVAGIR
jgi:chromosome segregation ATPase